MRNGERLLAQLSGLLEITIILGGSNIICPESRYCIDDLTTSER